MVDRVTRRHSALTGWLALGLLVGTFLIASDAGAYQIKRVLRGSPRLTRPPSAPPWTMRAKLSNQSSH